MKDKFLTTLSTDIRGKIRNMRHFYNEALMPVFEAVANSIQAIEDVIDIQSGIIDIKIIRENSFLETKADKKIICFEITDNGIGFNNDNFTSFCTSDSTYKEQKGCKGIGRFLWLKAFEKIEVVSTYKNGNDFYTRKLNLTLNGISHNEPVLSKNTELKTVVRLIGFNDNYYKQPTAYKTTSKIAQRILEHCLSYYITNKAPNITVRDDDETISLNDLYAEIKSEIVTEDIKLNGVSFQLHHVKLFNTVRTLHEAVLCADHRDVKRCTMSKLIGTSSLIDTGENKFVYSMYVESDYLDKNVDSTRQGFDFPDDKGELSAEIYTIALSEILTAIEGKAKEYLTVYIKKIEKDKKELIDKYLETENPTLRSVVKYCPEVYTEIEPNASNEKIDEILYAHKGKVEFKLKTKSKELLKTQFDSVQEIQDKVKDLEDKIEDFQKDNLASYLILRKMIIDLLAKKLELNTDGKYNKEDIVHDIIFPRKATSNDILFENHNLWLIDERLSFHSFVSSDKAINEITDGNAIDRPDVCVFSEIDDDNVARAVSLIEFKRPMREGFDKQPTSQLLGYVRKIRDKKINNRQGRPLLTNASTRYYCYAICDINNAIIEFAEDNNYSVLKNDLGYYSFSEKLNAEIEILAFNKLVTDAKQRHKIFFEMLGI